MNTSLSIIHRRSENCTHIYNMTCVSEINYGGKNCSARDTQTITRHAHKPQYAYCDRFYGTYLYTSFLGTLLLYTFLNYTRVLRNLYNNKKFQPYSLFYRLSLSNQYIVGCLLVLKLQILSNLKKISSFSLRSTFKASPLFYCIKRASK